MVKYKKYSRDDLILSKSYRYNPGGQRITNKVSRDSTLTTRHYHYLDGEVLYTTDENGALITQNLDGTDFTMRFDNSLTQAYLLSSDDRGSTTSAINSSNTGVTAYEYSDYGETTIKGSTSFENEVCYTGGIYDAETGDYYLNARYYNPDISRFSTMDTYRGEFEEPLSLNLYNYCSGNPINYVDPSGHHALLLNAPYAVCADGHAAFLAKFKVDNWHYCSWDNSKDGKGNVGTYKTKIKDKNANIKWLNKNYRKEINKYKRYIMFFGDFKKAISKYKIIRESEQYSLLKNNCTHVAMRCLCRGTFTKKGKSKPDKISKEIKKLISTKTKQISPNSTFRELSTVLKKKNIKATRKLKNEKDNYYYIYYICCIYLFLLFFNYYSFSS